MSPTARRQRPTDVTVTASLDPVQSGISPDYDWSATDRAIRSIAAVSNDTLTFAATGSLAAGRYTIDLVVTNDGASTHNAMTIEIRSGAIAPPDVDSDGVPDRIDSDGDGTLDQDIDTSTSATVLHGTSDGVTRHLLEAGDGAALRIGERAARAAGDRGTPDRRGALVTAEEIADLLAGVDNLAGLTNNGGWFDFEVGDLPAPGASARVVLPLQSGLRAGAVYYKYHPDNGWRPLDTAGDDAIASAARDDAGQCPAPGAGAWSGGLVAFDECIRLTLVDGGPNDSDGEINGEIRDPGGAIASAEVSTATTAAETELGDAGGGGWTGPFALVLLALSGLVFGRGRACNPKSARW